MQTFSEIHKQHLKELYIPIGWKNPQIINKDTGDVLDIKINKKLNNIPSKPNWDHANRGGFTDAYRLVKDAAIDTTYGFESFLILSNEEDDEPIGVISFKTSDELNGAMKLILDENVDWEYDPIADCIVEAYLVGFKENNFTLVKDMFRLLDQMIEKYEYIGWSVHNNAPVKKIYDKVYKSKKYEMFTSNPSCDKYSGEAYTQYVILGDGNL